MLQSFPMSASNTPEVVVAGYLCLDVIPSFPQSAGDVRDLLQPGKLVQTGPATLSSGGAVSNTGIALHRLGLRTRLMGKVGDDLLGRATLQLVRNVDPSLAEGSVVAKGESSSYTLVINPPGVDRMFLHFPGPNMTFCADDVAEERLAGARLFHFGYPPLMRRLYANGGAEMEKMLRRVKQQGLMTSLDMVMVDPRSEAARVDWSAWLQRVLPYVDVFLPSLDEARVELNDEHGDVRQIARKLQDWGAGIVGLKMGDQGLFVRWHDRELYSPCFEVKVAGTTGSGDATIAGFLAGLLRGLPPEEVMTVATAVGACCCEAADATSGIRSWDETRQRINAGWRRLPNKKGFS